MTKRTQDVELVVLGATGFTGRLVVARLALLEQRARASGGTFPRWAVAGRDAGRLRAVLDALPAPGSTPEVIADVDVHDRGALAHLAGRARVLLNAVGPYSPTAEAVVEACVAVGTHYADLSGELPLLRRVIDRFDAPARAAGCQVVQLAGWEALPPDVAGLHAARLAVGAGPDDWGPGASQPVRQLDVMVGFDEIPQVRGLNGSVSAGTMGGIVEIFADPGAAVVGDPAGLLPSRRGSGARAVRRSSPLRVRPFVRGRRLLGPVVPVAFLNPPVLHRTAALLATEAVAPHVPARVREGVDHGSVGDLATLRSLPGQLLASLAQRGTAAATRLPVDLRRSLASAARRRLPTAGTGPAPEALDPWRWTVRAEAVALDGRRGAATLSGTGHPGYTATAAMLVALGLHLAEPDRNRVVPGVVTPAVAFGPGLSPHLETPELSLTLG